MNSKPSTTKPGTASAIALGARRHAVVTAVAEAVAHRMDLPRGARIVVGVSGGADSLALLVALTVIARRRDAADRLVGEPIACHVHHHLRPDDDADADAAHVSEVCDRFGIMLETRHIHPRDNPGNLEAGARRMRYGALAEVATICGASHIATAHHADDQFETMLMAFCRGAGPDGLAGMAWQRAIVSVGSPDLSQVRPLLGVRRSDCESLCRAADIAWRDDVTNEDVTFARNRLRHEVMPVLESLWPGLADRAEFAADVMTACAALLEGQLSGVFGAADQRAWRREDLRALDAVLIVAGLRRALLAAEPGAADQLSTRTLRDAADAIRSDSTHPKQFALPGGWSVMVDARAVALSMGKDMEVADMIGQKQSSDSKKSVVLVGHCVPDQFMLRSAVQRALPDAQIKTVNNDRALKSHLHDDAILLVNRVLDGRFGVGGGIELIEHVRQSGNGRSPAMLLVSDLADAQQQAEQAGALPGFGKRELYDEQAIERLRAAAQRRDV